MDNMRVYLRTVHSKNGFCSAVRKHWPYSAVLVILGFLVAGCTCSIGCKKTGRTYQTGIGCTVMRRDLKGMMVSRFCPGLDLRVNTGDSGLSLGLARRVAVQPIQVHSDSTDPRARWRMGRFAFPFAIVCERGGEISVCGVALTECPRIRHSKTEPEPLFIGLDQCGVSVSASANCQGMGVGLEHRAMLFVNPYESWLYSLYYERSGFFRPATAVFIRHQSKEEK